MTPTKKTIHMNLIQNAKRSMNHAVEHLDDKHPVKGLNYIYPILDTIHVLELLFKEKLREVHPAFVFQNVDNYPNESKNTVNLDTAIKRITSLTDVEFDSNILATIDRLRKIRNQIQHYEFELEVKEVKSLMGKILSMIISFADNELGLNWESMLENNGEWSSLLEFYQFYEEHTERIEKYLSDNKISTLACPVCSANAYVINEEKCRVCGHVDDVFICDFCGDICFMSENIGYEEMCNECFNKRIEKE